MSKKELTAYANKLKDVTKRQQFVQWWYGVIEPYILKFSDYMLRTPIGTYIYTKMTKPKSLPSGVIISTEAACRFVDFIYSINAENNSACMAVTKCVCQTSLNKVREPQWKDMALLYAAEMYTTMKHTGIKERFYEIETAEDAKKKLRYFNECGLMHNVLYCNSSGKWTFVICNCDDEICIPYRAHMAGRKHEMNAGPEIVNLEQDQCTGIVKCGLCIKRCTLKASFVDRDNKSDVHYDQCLGCGLCVTTCKSNARKLVPRKDYQHEDILTTSILLGKK